MKEEFGRRKLKVDGGIRKEDVDGLRRKTIGEEDG